MISTFTVCKNKACGIQVKGLERDSDQYLNEPQVSIRNYTFEQTITLNVVSSLDSKQNETFDQSSIVPHIDIDIDDLTLDTDGLKQIDHYIIPTNEWLDYVIERDVDSLDSYSIVYFFNNQDEQFYKYIDGQLIKVELQEILEVNTTNTTIVKGSKNIFQTCHLEECLYKLCKYLLENMPCNDPCIDSKMSGFKMDILNRDIIWMAVNTINYCLKQGQFFKAQAIIEQVETCWGICRDLDNINSSNYSGCGCHS